MSKYYQSTTKVLPKYQMKHKDPVMPSFPVFSGLQNTANLHPPSSHCIGTCALAVLQLQGEGSIYKFGMDSAASRAPWEKSRRRKEVLQPAWLMYCHHFHLSEGY